MTSLSSSAILPNSSSEILVAAAAAAAITDPIDASIIDEEVVVDDVVVDALLTHAAAATATAANPNPNNKRKAAAEEEFEIPAAPPRLSLPSSTTRVSWEDRIRTLKEYKDQHGDLFIPIRYKANPSLGKFVHNTREQYKLFHKQTPANYKKKCSLTQERIDELNALGFVWNTQRTERQNEDWEKRYAQLVQFQKQNGHCLIPHGYEPDPGLAEWVHRQRTTYASRFKQQQQQQQLIQQRMNKLQDIGFNFTVHSDKWMVHYEQLVRYKQTFGNCQVPTHFTENTKLGRWVHTQRHQRRLQIQGKKSSMTTHRYQLLQQLGFAWEVRPPLARPRATWQQRYDEMRHFHMTYGHLRIIDHEIVEPELIQWAQEQKARLRAIANATIHSTSSSKEEGTAATAAAAARRLAPERVRLLQEIGFHKDVDLGGGDGSNGNNMSRSGEILLGSNEKTDHEEPTSSFHTMHHSATTPDHTTDTNHHHHHHHPSMTLVATTTTTTTTTTTSASQQQQQGEMNHQPSTTDTENVLNSPSATAMTTTTTDAVDGTMSLDAEGSLELV
jgi:hypothetical protein